MSIKVLRRSGCLGSWLASTGMVCLAAVSPAHGAGDEAAKPADDSVGLQEVIVTASKRPQNLQREAISITAVKVEELQSRGITEPGQLAGIAPGVAIQPTFVMLAYIRGIGNYTVQPNVDQSIAYNVDGIYVDRPYAMPDILFDLNRIELLRGPQGTLQGRNSIGGSINLVTAQPTNNYEARASVQAGNYSSLSPEAMINVPLSENLSFRVAAAHSEHKPYLDNGFSNGNTSGARLRVLATPSANLKILLTGEYTMRDEKGPGYTDCPPGNADAACAGIPWHPFAGTTGQGVNDAVSIAEPNFVKAENRSLYGEITYDLGFGSLTWVPSYHHLDYRNHSSWSHFFGFAPATHDSMHSEELRLASKADSRIVWVVGAYYGHQSSQEQNYFTTAAGPYITVNEPGWPQIGHVFFKNDIDSYVYTSQSMFAQVSVPLQDTFRIVAGGRYTEDKKTVESRNGLVGAGPNGPVLVSAPGGGRLSTDKFTYKAGLEYDAQPSVMLYANYSTGFKAGGVNAQPAGGTLPPMFEPETIKAIQAGVKSRFMDNRVQINAEAFHYDLDGYQTSFLLPGPGGLLIGGSVNAQNAELYGAELEASFVLSPSDRLDIAPAYLHAEHKKFVIPATGLDLSNKPMSNSPEFTLTGNYSHRFALTGGAGVTAHLETHYESSQWADFRLTPGTYVPSFWRHAADVTYNPSDDRWTVGAYIRNITNDGSLMHAVGGLGLYTVGMPYPPRTFGVRVTANF